MAVKTFFQKFFLERYCSHPIWVPATAVLWPRLCVHQPA